MGLRNRKAAVVNLLVQPTQWRDMMSKRTAAASAIQISSPAQTLMLAFELGEGAWLLGFSAGFGEAVLRRKDRFRATRWHFSARSSRQRRSSICLLKLR